MVTPGPHPLGSTLSCLDEVVHEHVGRSHWAFVTSIGRRANGAFFCRRVDDIRVQSHESGGGTGEFGSSVERLKLSSLAAASSKRFVAKS